MQTPRPSKPAIQPSCRKSSLRKLAGACFALSLLSLTGCLGPTTIRETRNRYNEAIRQTNEEEMLLNLVRLRYGEHPSFLPVTGLNAQFEVNAGTSFRSGAERGGTDNWGSGAFSYADRPTLTFAPQRPPQMTKALLTQVNLETLYLFSRQGSDIGRIFRLFIRTINGIDNAASGGGPVPPSPPAFVEFRTITEAMGRLQRQGLYVLTNENEVTPVDDSISLAKLDAKDLVEIKKAGYGVAPIPGELNSTTNAGYRLTQTKQVRVLELHDSARDSADVRDVLMMLNLHPLPRKFPVIEASEGQFVRTASDQPSEAITVTTRSILEVMYLLSKTVSVPEEHAAKGILAFTHNPDGSLFDWRMVTGDLFKVCVAKHRPHEAYVSVKYRGYWYYIDDRDISSKTTLNLFNELLRLQRVGATEGSPILTLPLGP